MFVNYLFVNWEDDGFYFNSCKNKPDIARYTNPIFEILLQINTMTQCFTNLMDYNDVKVILYLEFTQQRLFLKMPK